MPSYFVERYLNWFLNSTDAPMAFAHASALMCLSSVANGKRWLEGANQLNANIYMMIIGPSSKARKTTTIRRATDVVKSVIPERAGPTDYTPEGLFKTLNEKTKSGGTRNCMTIFSNEFAADLARSAAYKTSFRDDLTNLYDGFDIDKVRSGEGKSVKVLAPRVSLCGAITYESLSEHIGLSDWGTGFMMRFLYVAPTEWRPTRLVEAGDDKGRRFAAYDGMYNLANLMETSDPCGLTFSPEAQAEYERLYQQHQAQVEAENVSGREQLQEIYLSRFWPNIKKMSLLYQLDEDPFSEVSLTAFLRAYELARLCWRSYLTAQRETTTGDFRTLAIMICEALHAAKSGVKTEHPGLDKILLDRAEGAPPGIQTAHLIRLFNYSPNVDYVLRFLKRHDIVTETAYSGRKWLFSV